MARSMRLGIHALSPKSLASGLPGALEADSGSEASASYSGTTPGFYEGLGSSYSTPGGIGPLEREASGGSLRLMGEERGSEGRGQGGWREGGNGGVGRRSGSGGGQMLAGRGGSVGRGSNEGGGGGGSSAAVGGNLGRGGGAGALGGGEVTPAAAAEGVAAGVQPLPPAVVTGFSGGAGNGPSSAGAGTSSGTGTSDEVAAAAAAGKGRPPKKGKGKQKRGGMSQALGRGN